MLLYQWFLNKTLVIQSNAKEPELNSLKFSSGSKELPVKESFCDKAFEPIIGPRVYKIYNLTNSTNNKEEESYSKSVSQTYNPEINTKIVYIFKPNNINVTENQIKTI